MIDRIGIFGGTFDPPHLGHMILASEALCQLKLDKVLFMLSPDPPHKREQEKSNVQHRFKMLQTMIKNDSNFGISTVDLDRPGPHYTVDSMHLLHQMYPNAKLVYLMGADSLQSLYKVWYKAAEFVELCDEIGVMLRPSTHLDTNGLEEHYPGINQKIRLIDAPLLEISSSEIRDRIQSDGHYRYYLDKEVYQYLNQHQVYPRKDSATPE
jgi:nicotinate-nucleotide adenylyltransferase